MPADGVLLVIKIGKLHSVPRALWLGSSEFSFECGLCPLHTALYLVTVTALVLIGITTIPRCN
jgi:hypothetical protein